MNVQIDSNDNSNVIEMIDTLNGLSNFHYTQCDNSSSSEVKMYRGLIKNEKGEIVCRSFGYTPEVNETDEESMKTIVEPFLSQGNLHALVSYEATLLRVFHFENKWYVSTCRKIDAFKSKWGGSKSFGELFADCITSKSWADEDAESKIQGYCNDTLNKDKIYCFVLRTYDENRIVCRGFSSPQLYMVGNFDKEGNFDISECNVEMVLSPTSIDELKEEMGKLDSTKSQGIILINSKGDCVKVMKKEYVEAFALRGNQPNVLLRYIELQQKGDPEKVEKYFEMYPEHRDLIIQFTDVMDDICIHIFRKYHKRFIKKEVAIVPPDMYYVIRELHDGFLKDRKNIVTPERVISHVHTLQPLRLLSLFNSYNKRKAEFGNGNKLSKEFLDKVKGMIIN